MSILPPRRNRQCGAAHQLCNLVKPRLRHRTASLRDASREAGALLRHLATNSRVVFRDESLADFALDSGAMRRPVSVTAVRQGSPEMHKAFAAHLFEPFE